MAEALKLNTAQERKQVEIDGKRYPVRNVDEIPFFVLAQMQSVNQSLTRVYAVFSGDEKAEKASPEEIKATVQCVRDSIKAITIGLDEKADELSDQQALALFTYFLQGPAKAQEAEPAPKPSETMATA